MNLLDRFMVALGFQVDSEGMEKFERQTNELRSAALRLGSIMTGAAVGVGIFVKEISEGMNKVYEFSELNQVAVKSVEAMKLVGIDYGIEADSMQESLGALVRKTGEAAAGIGRGAMIFKRLGLSAKDASGHTRSLSDMLDVLAHKMQGNDRAKNIAIAERLGMDPKTVLLLEQGGAKLRALREEAEKMVPFGEDDYKKAHEVDIAFVKAQRSIGLISKMIAVQLMPWVLRALQTFQLWFKELRSGGAERITEVFRIMGAVISTLWDYLYKLVKATKDAVSWLLGFKVVLIAVSVLISALIAYKVGAFFMTLADAVGVATKAMTSFKLASMGPAVVLGGLIIAIGLLIDDLWNFYHGGDSVIGQLQEKYPYAIYIAWTALGVLGSAFVALKWKAIASIGETLALMSMYAAEWVGIAASAVASVATQIASVAGLAVAWITAHLSMAAATLAAYWPVLLVIAALALVVAGVWLVWKNWDKITQWIRKAWKFVVDEIKAGINWIVDKIMWLAVQGDKIISKLPGGKKYLSLFGVDADKLPANGRFTPASSGNVIGRASSSATTFNNQRSMGDTHINAPITVLSTDPDRAGKDVKRELDRKHREVIRNGQSAVAY
jgi:hypothetical protein